MKGLRIQWLKIMVPKRVVQIWEEIWNLKKKSEKLEKIIVSKENNKFANPLPFPTTLQKQKVGDKT